MKVKPFAHLSYYSGGEAWSGFVMPSVTSGYVCVFVCLVSCRVFRRPLHLLSLHPTLLPPSPPLSPPPVPPPSSVPLRSALQSASHIRLFIPGFPPPRASLSFATVALMACQLCLLACTVLQRRRNSLARKEEKNIYKCTHIQGKSARLECSSDLIFFCTHPS